MQLLHRLKVLPTRWSNLSIPGRHLGVPSYWGRPISESHYFSKYRDSIHNILIPQHDVDLLLEFMSLLLFIEVVVQAHVDEALNVCRRLQVHC